MSESPLVKIWHLLPTTFSAIVLLLLAVISIASGALEFHGGRVIVITFVALSIVPVLLSLGELAPQTRSR